MCMEPLGHGVLSLSHVLFVAHLTSDQIDQIRAFTIAIGLARQRLACGGASELLVGVDDRAKIGT